MRRVEVLGGVLPWKMLGSIVEGGVKWDRTSRTVLLFGNQGSVSRSGRHVFCGPG